MKPWRPNVPGNVLLTLGLALVFCTAGPNPTAASWRFADVTLQAGFDYSHGYTAGITSRRMISSGVAAGDYDGDGWVDLYIASGDAIPNLLFRNLGNGTFENVAVSAGVDLPGSSSVGPTFADIDGDGLLDLLMGGVHGTPSRLFRNEGDGTFADVTDSRGIVSSEDTYSAALGDYDRDGDLDVLLSHWSQTTGASRLWRNEGDRLFDAADRFANIGFAPDYSFTPNFADIDNDGWPDILFACDFGSSQVLINNRDGTFTNTTTAVISDENGMGSAVGDYDNDGDLDWFVSSIFEETPPQETWGITGNRLYRNRGDGTFEDATDEAGVRKGHWGWGSTFADLDNDGDLDIFHVNGWVPERFATDPARLFVSNGDGTFDERSTEVGLDDSGQGRGVACFDYDRDGDLDVFIANNGQAPKLYRNDGGIDLGSLSVRLRGAPPNTEAIGARVYLTNGATTQMRELRAGSNFSSQDPARAHFGLGNATRADRVRIVWPDGSSETLVDVAANQELVVSHPMALPLPQPPAPNAVDLAPVYPNPFRAEALIRFGLPVAGHAKLEVFNVLGQKVAVVLDRHMSAGFHELLFRSTALASGIYFYRLQSAGATVTRKMILVQ